MRRKLQCDVCICYVVIDPKTFFSPISIQQAHSNRIRQGKNVKQSDGFELKKSCETGRRFHQIKSGSYVEKNHTEKAKFYLLSAMQQQYNICHFSFFTKKLCNKVKSLTA